MIDVLHSENLNSKSLSRFLILPSGYRVGHRFMQQLLQDSITIVHYFEHCPLFNHIHLKSNTGRDHETSFIRPESPWLTRLHYLSISSPAKAFPEWSQEWQYVWRILLLFLENSVSATASSTYVYFIIFQDRWAILNCGEYWQNN